MNCTAKVEDNFCSMAYKPLPRGLAIKESKIHGLGLFTEVDIYYGDVLGPSHIKLNETSLVNDDYIAYFHDNGVLRTPLGGFINHSDNPNLELHDAGAFYVIKTIRTIKAGEELTIKYSSANDYINKTI